MSRQGPDFVKAMDGTPSPIVGRRFAPNGRSLECCDAILPLTKMDWNNEALCDCIPVTLRYAGRAGADGKTRRTTAYAS